MKTKNKRKTALLIILLAFSFGLSSFHLKMDTNREIYLNQKPIKTKLSPKKSTSGSINLSYNVGFTISGFSDNYIEWEFETSPIIDNISIKALNHSQFQLYLNKSSPFVCHTIYNGNLSNNNGNFTVPYGDNWNVVFSNVDSSKNTVILYFIVNFYNQSLKVIGDNNNTDLTMQFSLIILGISVGSCIVSISAFIIFKRRKDRKKLKKLQIL